MTDIVAFQTKVYNLPKDIHFILREYGVQQIRKQYLTHIGKLNINKYDKLNNEIQKREAYKKHSKWNTSVHLHRFEITVDFAQNKFIYYYYNKKCNTCVYTNINDATSIKNIIRRIYHL